MNDYRAEYERWLLPPFDEQTRSELASLGDEEIKDRFYRDLSFGTGGLRGVLGAGTNRMNRYTVGRATQGICDLLRSEGETGGVAIAYDSRKMSAEFALDAALIFAANGIKAYLFESLRPTPELSFAVRYLHAAAGIVITASHNPPQYNGYKVYQSDGGQLVPPRDAAISAAIEKVSYAAIKRIGREEAEQKGLLELLGEELDSAYLAAIKELSLEPEAIARYGKELKIVYTPLNGTGNVPVRRILKELGFCNVSVVPEQELPDGNFPTLPSPNPEDPRAFAYALRLAEETGADLALATDPDADRLGVYARGADGNFYPFTGNMSGLLLAEYVLSRREAKGLLPANGRGALVTTIVSSAMAAELAKRYRLTFLETLTGFKYIGEQIKLLEEKGCAFAFGFEESYGCLFGSYARDKDAVAAVAMLCEAAAYYKSLGRTLPEQMELLYQTYGYFKEGLFSVTLNGAEGAEKIGAILGRLRSCPPATIGGEAVVAVRDYQTGIRTELATGKTSPLRLPKSNVLYFELTNGWCCVRPSGTEPKIKYYFGIRGDSARAAEEKLERLKAALTRFTD